MLVSLLGSVNAASHSLRLPAGGAVGAARAMKTAARVVPRRCQICRTEQRLVVWRSPTAEGGGSA
eukprot:2508294-Lingulodinium_polyedra.AAC.1